MKTKFIVAILIFCLVGALLPFGSSIVHAASIQKESEPNDYASQANVVSLANGNSIVGYGDLWDEDYYKFTITKGSEIKVKVSSQEDDIGSKDVGRVAAFLYTEGLDSIDVNVDAYYDENWGYVKAENTWCLSPGTYYMKVIVSAESNEKYTLKFETNDYENFNEPNDYMGQATRINLNHVYQGVLTNNNKNGENDYFKLAVPQDGNYYFVCNNKSNNVNVLDLDIYNAEGDRLYSTCMYESDNSVKKKMTLSKGSVYVNISTDNNIGLYDFYVVRQLSAPSKNVVKLYGYDDIVATWKAVSGATGYYVYYKTKSADNYTYWGSTTSNSVKFANLKDGYRYYVRVVPYEVFNGQTFIGKYKTSSGLYTLKKINKPSIKKSSSKYITINWKNISGESGYQIARSKYKSKNFKVIKTVSSKYKKAKIKTTRYKTYYYKVRAYKTVDGKKIYGPWSSVKSYKLK